MSYLSWIGFRFGSRNKCPKRIRNRALSTTTYKYDNLLFDSSDLTRIVAVLDWELATVGDPLMDLGTTLGYWVEASDPAADGEGRDGTDLLAWQHVPDRELLDRYASRTGRIMPNAVFYYCFGLFKIAVIIQQIYAPLRAR